MTSVVALAAPVVVGIMDRAAARARRGSLCEPSRMRWLMVYECTVVIRPCLMPNASWMVLAAGARQLVVHEAAEITSCLAGS